MLIDVIRVDLTADAAGAASLTTVSVNGLLHAVYANFGTAAAGTDTTIKSLDPDVNLLVLTDTNTDGWYMPRGNTHDPAGAARLYAAGGTNVADRFPVAGQMQVSIAQAGNGGTATFYLFVERSR